MSLLSPATPTHATFSVSLRCELPEVRFAVRSIRQFLEDQGLHEEELISCELALVEACNNAVQYTPETARHLPIRVQVISSDSRLEFRVRDHTTGFNWRDKVPLPDNLSESGRGLYIIQASMDKCAYFPGAHGNTLVLRKNRYYQGHRNGHVWAGSLEEANRRLAECERVISEMAKELCFRSESLSAIYRCTAQAGRVGSLNEFAHNLLDDLLHISSADWFVLRLLSRETNELVVFEASDLSLKWEPIPLSLESFTNSVEAEAATQKEDVWFHPDKPLEPDDPLAQGKVSSCGLVRPFFHGEMLLGTLTIGKTEPDSLFTPAQVEVIHSLAEFLTIQIVNAQLQEDRISHRLVAHELEIARNIQKALMPKSLPEVRGFTVAGYCENARQVGGDFFDVIRLTESCLLMAVADVMGKGVPAALFAAILHRLIRAIPEWTQRPSEMLSRLNGLMYQDLSKVDMFITAQLILVDTQKRRLTVASAGHCPVLVSSNDQPLLSLSPDGMPLGISPNTTFKDQTIDLGPNSRILLYTDGVTDARNGTEEAYGHDRLAKWMTDSLAQNGNAEQLKASLSEELRTFQGSAPLRDDQTFVLVVEKKASEEDL